MQPLFGRYYAISTNNTKDDKWKKENPNVTALEFRLLTQVHPNLLTAWVKCKVIQSSVDKLSSSVLFVYW